MLPQDIFEQISQALKKKEDLTVSYLYAFTETTFKSMTTSSSKQDALLQVSLCKVLVQQMHEEIWQDKEKLVYLTQLGSHKWINISSAILYTPLLRKYKSRLESQVCFLLMTTKFCFRVEKLTAIYKMKQL